MAVPGHRYLKVALGAGPGHEGTHLGAQFKAELDRYFVGAIGERPQLGDQSLHRWLHPGDGLLEALPGLLDHATVPVPQPRVTSTSPPCPSSTWMSTLPPASSGYSGSRTIPVAPH